jgi:hypothetical protein
MVQGDDGLVVVALKDGRRFEVRAEGGMLEPGELDDKFTRLTRGTIGEAAGTALLARLRGLEDEAGVGWLGA